MFVEKLIIRFFVVANAVVSGYLVLSLVLSFFHIVRTTATNSRIILITFDAVIIIADTI